LPIKLSVSRITAYNTCSAKFAFQYIEQIKCPSRSPLLFGSSFHVSEAENYRQKIKTEQDLSVSDVCDIFSTQFEEGSHDVMWQPDEDKGEIKDSGYSLIGKYHEIVTPNIQPAFVEQEFELKLKGADITFTGIMDLVTKDKKLRELKTKSRKPSAVEDNHKLQVTTYTAGYIVTNKEKPSEIWLDYAVHTKTPQIISYPVTVTDSDIRYLLSLIGAVKNGIEKGIAIPNRSSMMCSRKYCSYCYECENVYGGTVKGD
jgi:CRISPR/Cas system-associated exonuclease Cas4 (RecB family)